jgi:hypothetical protein
MHYSRERLSQVGNNNEQTTERDPKRITSQPVVGSKISFS